MLRYDQPGIRYVHSHHLYGDCLYSDIHSGTCFVSASWFGRQRGFLCFHAYDENRQVFGKDCGYFLSAGYPAPVCKQQSCSFGNGGSNHFIGIFDAACLDADKERPCLL